LEEKIDNISEKLKDFFNNLTVDKLINLLKKGRFIKILIGFLIVAGGALGIYLKGGGVQMPIPDFGFYFHRTMLANTLTINDEKAEAQDGYVFVRVDLIAGRFTGKPNITTDDFLLVKINENDEQPETYNVKMGFFVQEDDVQHIRPTLSTEKGSTDLIMVFEIRYRGVLTQLDLTQYKIIAFPDSESIRWEAVLTPAANL